MAINLAITMSFIFKFMQAIDRNNRWLEKVYNLINTITLSLAEFPRVGQNNNKHHLHTMLGFSKNWPQNYEEFGVVLKNRFTTFLI